MIDIARSRVYAHVHKTGFGHEHGVEGQLVSGRLALAARESSGEMTFDMTSFRADTAAARRYVGLDGEQDASTQQKVTQTMRGPDVLDIGRHPTASFQLQRAVPRAGTTDKWDLYGDFTLHGVTRPVQISAEATTDGAYRRIRGGFSIRQSEFGIRPLRKALGAVGVADEMEIWGDLWVSAN